MPKISASARRSLTEERRKQILNAASQVFAEKGFERATISDIAKKAGMAEGSIYNYFKNKADLLVSIPRQIVETPVEAVNTAMKTTLAGNPLPPQVVLTTMAQNVVGVIRQNAPIFRILISALPSMKQSMREKYFSQVILYASGILESYFLEQINQGVFRKDLEPQIMARAFIGMFFPYILLHEVIQLETDASWDYERMIRVAVPLFLQGAFAESSQRQK